MTEPAPEGEAFSLFDDEERILSSAHAMLSRLGEVSTGVNELAEGYRCIFAEYRRLLRISDRLQFDLHKANRTLHAQAGELRQLNASLETEVRRREALTQELRLIATTDMLTGLHTRRHVLELAAREESRWQRYGGSLSLLLIDIDHFKRVNDSHGHATGDEVLRQFADMCREAMRNSDLMGRFGGEEFLMVLPETDAAQAMLAAEKLRAHVAATPMQIGGQRIEITISIGVSELAGNDVGIDQAISRADAALYAAKRAGRNRVTGDDHRAQASAAAGESPPQREVRSEAP